MRHIFILTVMFFFISLPYAMADLNTLLEMQAQQQQRDFEAQRQLGKNIGNIMQQRSQRAFERHAFEFFGTEPITYEKIRQFSSMYPNAPLAEIYEVVETIKRLRR